MDLETWGALPTRLIVDERLYGSTAPGGGRHRPRHPRRPRALLAPRRPAEAPAEAAIAAMARALSPHNTATAETILHETGVRPPRRRG
ncbi:hypothetical protein Sgou_18890 [Streptomyces gougerotii]|uniref:Uncharacterized protein n=1 Tax=Streptomyces gougerotii TaxID=53448 RepID=A0ABQ1D3X3_9ACTN|nr:hypothetical protein [Streptomyces gougerotii]GFH77219.1 hypothetical protein Sgou_18890 [Streptomyces gougerotii]